MKIELNDPKNTFIEFQWQYSKFCNKNCFYCTTQNEKYFSKNKYLLNQYEEKEYFYILKEITYFFKKINKDEGFLNLFGGEPFLHPKFFHTIKYFTTFFNNMNNKNFYLFITTNGSLLNSLNKIKNDLDFQTNKIFLSISYHYYNTKIDDFINQINSIKNNFNYIVSSIIPDKINTNQKTYINYKKNIQKILDNNLNIEFKLQLDPYTLKTNPTKKTENFLQLNNYNFLKKLFKIDLDLNNLKINNNIYHINSSSFFKGFPILKENVCYNYQPGLFYKNSELFFGFSCNEGQMISIKKLIKTNSSLLKFFINHFKINCKRNTCTESRHKANYIKLNTNNDFEKTRINSFLKEIK